MIVALKGKLVRSGPFMAVIDVNGVYYELSIPLTTAEKLPKCGAEILLHTVAVYREDSQSLYGFYSESDRDFFKTIIEKVSGIGPKIAINMMSRMSARTLSEAIAAGDVAMLSKCPGIGKKTAERLVLELKGGLSGIVHSAAGTSQNPAAAATNFSDAVAALSSLGFKPADADKAVRAAEMKLGSDASTEALVKAALSK